MRLTKGPGSPEQGAGCWMVAASIYANEGWGDQPTCVDPVIRALCIRLNDRLPDSEREAIIGPHLFAPIGTNQGAGLTQKRAFVCADRAVRVFAARVHPELAKVPPIVCEGSAGAANAAANAANAAYAANAAAYAAYAAANAAAYASCAAAYAADAAANAAAYASCAAAYAADVAADVLQLILDLCAMGDRIELDAEKRRRVEEEVSTWK